MTIAPPLDDSVLAYVKASAALLALSLDDAQAMRVAAHLARTAAMARLLENGAGLTPQDEPAEIFSPIAQKPGRFGLR